jgi:multisubunit Na+/H+ antiporter MnhB subunit
VGGVIRRKLLGLVLILILGYIMAGFVMQMPPIGSPDSPAYTHIIPRYLEKSVEETGATNIVTSILLDYRAYDTLGEATVLFTAALAILSLTGENE